MQRRTRILAICTNLLFSALAAALASKAVVETMITDINNAKSVYKHIGSIWEPVPPSNDYFILGQSIRATTLRPPDDYQLIVGRSVNGSLIQPLNFDYPWKISPGRLTVWRMDCPEGYVALGAIASQSEKPDVTKYRCVIKEATFPAIPGSVAHSDQSRRHVMRYVGLSAGWQSTFFFVEYLYTSQVQTTFYTLRQLYIAPTPMPSTEAVTTHMNRGDVLTTDGVQNRTNNTNAGHIDLNSKCTVCCDAPADVCYSQITSFRQQY
uniref:Uncharacterized protein n=1 Tax=Ciona savignyi TaxID=51511 RepID=H2YLM4_CIOSA